MATYRSDDFTGADGAAWSTTNWANAGTNGTATIQGGWGRITRNTGRVGRRVNATLPANLQTSVTFRVSHTTAVFPRFYQRANAALDSGRGYAFEPRWGSAGYSLSRFGSQTTTYSGNLTKPESTAPFTFTPGTIYQLKMETETTATSVVVRVKVWEQLAGEPAQWTEQWTDDTAGRITTADSTAGIAFDASVTGSHLEVDNFEALDIPVAPAAPVPTVAVSSTVEYTATEAADARVVAASASIEYTATDAVPAAGFFRIVAGQIVRPHLYRIVNGRIVSQADGATAPDPPEYGAGAYGTGTYGR